jgi:hypothetical protein
MVKNISKFTSMTIKDETSSVIGQVAAKERMKMYELVDQVVREKYPTYY